MSEHKSQKTNVENTQSILEKIGEVSQSETSILPVDTNDLEEQFFSSETKQRVDEDVEEEEKKRAKLHTERLRQENKERDDLHSLRTENLPKLRKLVSWWLSVVVIFTFLVGLKISLPTYFSFNSESCETCFKIGFNLSDGVLIAFITSTTASVIGLFLIAAKWLYPSSKDKESSHFASLCKINFLP